MYKAQCHCGNVKLEVSELTSTATQCTCSICRRYAAVWGYFSEQTVRLHIGDKGIKAYRHGDEMIDFYHCDHCGCLTHYRATTPTPESRFAVNYNMFDPNIKQALHIRTFDGADTWQYLD